MNDLRFALRLPLKQPGFTIAVVLTLALGIGATTAIFGVIESLILTPLTDLALQRAIDALRGRTLRASGATGARG